MPTFIGTVWSDEPFRKQGTRNFVEQFCRQGLLFEERDFNFNDAEKQVKYLLRLAQTNVPKRRLASVAFVSSRAMIGGKIT
jgi:hypothetical protein